MHPVSSRLGLSPRQPLNKLCQSLLCLALLALSLLMSAATPAHAQWVPYQTTNSLNPTSSATYPTLHTTPSPQPASNGFGATAYAGGSADLSVSGQVTLSFQWQGLAGQPVTPLYVLLNGQADAIMYSPASFSASDGLGDTAIPTTPQGAPFVVTDISMGKHLVQKTAPPNAGPGYVLSLDPITLSASADPGSNAYVGLSGTVDTRGLTLSRSGTTPTGILLSPDGQPHGEYVDASGTGHGETTYSYIDNETNDGTGSSEQDDGNWQTFSANFQGGWSTRTYINEVSGQSYTDYDVTWSWYPSESNDTLHTGLWKMPYGGMNIDNGIWVGTPSPAVPGYITYTATDNQNPATATATYDLTVHEPWDNKRASNPATTLNTTKTFLTGPDGFPIGVGNTTNQTQAAVPQAGLSITASATLGFSFTSGFTVDWAEALGIAVNLNGTLSATVSVTSPGPELPPQQESFPYVLTSWTTDHYWLDNYSSAGYIGTPVESADDPGSGTHLLCWTTPQPISQSPP
jgi:hypothetical protein